MASPPQLIYSLQSVVCNYVGTCSDVHLLSYCFYALVSIDDYLEEFADGGGGGGAGAENERHNANGLLQGGVCAGGDHIEHGVLRAILCEMRTNKSLCLCICCARPYRECRVRYARERLNTARNHSRKQQTNRCVYQCSKYVPCVCQKAIPQIASTHRAPAFSTLRNLHYIMHCCCICKEYVHMIDFVIQCSDSLYVPRGFCV